MNTLILMVGLPRSGKSTAARKEDCPIVSTDAIRQALGVYPFVPTAEKMVWTLARYMVESLFNAGHKKVILDSTNLSKKLRNEWKSSKWKRKYIVLHTTPEECIERAKMSGQEYLIPVIEKMAQTCEPVIEEEYDL